MVEIIRARFFYSHFFLRRSLWIEKTREPRYRQLRHTYAFLTSVSPLFPSSPLRDNVYTGPKMRLCRDWYVFGWFWFLLLFWNCKMWMKRGRCDCSGTRQGYKEKLLLLLCLLQNVNYWHVLDLVSWEKLKEPLHYFSKLYAKRIPAVSCQNLLVGRHPWLPACMWNTAEHYSFGVLSKPFI